MDRPCLGHGTRTKVPWVRRRRRNVEIWEFGGELTIGELGLHENKTFRPPVELGILRGAQVPIFFARNSKRLTHCGA